MMRVVVTGVSGRMGTAVVELVAQTPQLQLVGVSERPDSVLVGQPLSDLVKGAPALIKISGTLGEALDAGAEVVVDFSTPEASVSHAQACAQRGIALVVGTTGFSAEAQQHLATAAKKIAMVVAPNLSVGVNVTMAVAAQLARQLGEGFDVEIVETHHRMKRDAPSGTALKLAQVLKEALQRNDDDLCLSRVGDIGARPAAEIGVQTLRGGDVVGEHTVFFLGDGERVELTHRATSRIHFARGALRAAAWILNRPAGLYSMNDVLGLS